MTAVSALRKNIFALSFFYSLPFGLLLYFNSSLLIERGLSEQASGVVLAGGYALSMLIMLTLPRLLRLYGNRMLFVVGTFLCAVLFLLVSMLHSPVLVAILLAVGIGVAVSTHVLFDIFLATTSGDVDKVGGRRGLFATLQNVAYILAQLLSIIILAHAALAYLYATAALALFVLAITGGALVRRFRDAPYEPYDWPGVWQRLSESKDLRSVFFIQLLLRIFYSVMVIYTPLYLHHHLGIPFESMALIFAVMIIPFLFLEIPVGRLEDSAWGEQEVLITGFVLLAITTGVLSFIVTPSIAVWAVALFATRVGASLVDIGSETYFFKHIHGGDSGEVSAFRVLHPLAYIIGPLASALFLYVFPLQYLFIALGILMLLGVIPSLILKDTK